jgi:hypothetical protein
LVAAAGCYNDAPSQSTLPQFQPQAQFVSGPPGGDGDPGYGYGQSQAGGEPSFEAEEIPPGETAAPPSEMAPPEAPVAAPADLAAPAPEPGPGPTADGEDGEDDDDVADATPTPDGATAPTASVTEGEITATLDGYGQWIETDDYGQVWRPDATVVGVDFTPYESGGSWQYSDAGWAFACDYRWGWLPFHYGRWAWFHDYWGWVPGHRWSPAWVEWRHGGGIVGWRPRAPHVRDHRVGGRDFHHGSGPVIRDHRHPEQHDASWRFAAVHDFGRPHIRSHLYRNPAEGLRVTSTVAAPPLRARTSVRSGDIMRNRFATDGRAMQPAPGRDGGPQQVRDHRSPEAGRAYQPAQGDRPTRYQPYNPPVRTYQPPVRTQPYNPPARTYQPPVRSDNPAVRTYQPPVRNEHPPARTYQPPARTFRPHAPSSAPSRSWSPPPSSGSSHSSSSSSGSHSSSGSSHSSSGSSHSSSGSSHSSGGSSHSSGGSSHSSGGSSHHR